MKKLSHLLLLAVLIISCNAQSPEKLAEENGSIDSTKVIHPSQIHPKLNTIITKILTNYHYTRPMLNDSVSSMVFDNFLSSLDNNKMYFLQKDITEFEKYRFNFDENLLEGNLNPAFEIFNRYKQRMNEIMKFIIPRLHHDFVYDIDEYYVPDRSEADWAVTDVELNNLWRKRLKNEMINLLLNGKENEGAVEVLEGRYKTMHKYVLRYKAEDVFQLYLNSFSEAIDPHTNYFSPKTSEDFKINMSLSLEGIGAQLTVENEFTKVAHVIPGGPAYKTGELFDNDRIVGVAQGEDGEMIDVVGWRVDDVVQLIRGKKGTLVRLRILRAGDTPDMPTDDIKIVRDKVKLEEQAAQKEIININEDGVNFKLGVIKVPAFYSDFEAKARGESDFKSTTRDVKKILYELKEEKVDGVIVDLRNNGGGSLQEAIDLTGLFIKYGPVVQVRNSNGSVEVGEDVDPAIVYDGPLAVMVNRNSASASEIFSGAIQDYGRGLIIGERTFGKGTVQNLIDLNRFVPIKNEKLGQLKLTIAKYYRVTGNSTQRMGVIPDVIFPTEINSSEYGESAQPTALEWDKINSAKFYKYGDISQIMHEVLNKHSFRIRRDPEFHYLMDEIEEYKERREKKSFSLKLDERKAEKEKLEERRKQREELRQKRLDIKIVNKEEVETQESKIDDPLLEEGGRILADVIIMDIG
ncbi:MAG: carboxy terminal-processing peptidase [Ignavibacteria bacterium]